MESASETTVITEDMTHIETNSEVEEEVKEEARIIKYDATRRAQPCPSSVKEEAKEKSPSAPIAVGDMQLKLGFF